MAKATENFWEFRDGPGKVEIDPINNIPGNYNTLGFLKGFYEGFDNDDEPKYIRHPIR